MKNIKELLEFGLLLQVAIVDSLQDKKITLMDFPKFIGVISSAGPAFTDIEAVKTELANLTEPQKKELYQFVVDKFDLPDDDKEALIEETIKILIELYALAVKWSTFRKA